MSVKNISANDLKVLLKNRENLEMIDVREPSEYRIIHLKGSKSIPMNELQGRANEVDWTKEVVFICRSGARSGIMANLLSVQGHEINNLRSGIYECFMDKDCPDLEILKEEIDMYF